MLTSKPQTDSPPTIHDTPRDTTDLLCESSTINLNFLAIRSPNAKPIPYTVLYNVKRWHRWATVFRYLILRWATVLWNTNKIINVYLWMLNCYSNYNRDYTIFYYKLIFYKKQQSYISVELPTKPPVKNRVISRNKQSFERLGEKYFLKKYLTKKRKTIV